MMERFRIILLVLITIFVASTISGCGKGNKKNADNLLLQQTTRDTAKISFREYEHDFGKVAEGEEVAYTFMFENKGQGYLIINSAITSCGCTVPKYDTKPIPPGGKGNLEVVFDTSGRNGIQTKIITVNSNASKPVILLKITAEVITSTNN
jgi:hypothetical protein